MGACVYVARFHPFWLPAIYTPCFCIPDEIQLSQFCSSRRARTLDSQHARRIYLKVDNGNELSVLKIVPRTFRMLVCACKRIHIGRSIMRSLSFRSQCLKETNRISIFYPLFPCSLGCRSKVRKMYFSPSFQKQRN